MTAQASSGQQCALIDPLATALQQVESQWNTNAGPHGAPQFGGQIPDIAYEVDSGAGCSGITAALTPVSSGSGSGGSGSSEPQQCQLIDPVAGALQEIEEQWNTNAGSHGAPEFGAGQSFPDIAYEIDSGAGCSGVSELGAPKTTSSSSPAPPSGTTGSSGSNGGSGAVISASSGFGTGSTSAGSGALAMTGEPSWIPTAGILALVLAALAALASIGLRLAGRRTTRTG